MLHATKSRKIASRKFVRSGYTLVEMLIVIAIILFLSSLIIGAALGVRSYVYAFQTKAKLAKMADAIKHYAANHENLYGSDRYPYLLEWCISKDSLGDFKDEWGFEIRYDYNASTDIYSLFSVGPDGRPLTYDDIPSPPLY